MLLLLINSIYVISTCVCIYVNECVHLYICLAYVTLRASPNLSITVVEAGGGGEKYIE